MARPSKLSVSQCAKIRTLRAEKHIPVSKLAGTYGVSESSLYKVLDGTYVARPDPRATASVKRPSLPAQPAVQATPSIFHGDRQEAPAALQVRRAAAGAQPIDEVTLAAAELIVARAHYARAVSHTH